MGVERVVRFPGGSPPDWPAVTAKLADAGEPGVLRMIDGLPAFPDEVPAAGWQELRVGVAGGMVTLRRTDAEVRCVTWGTADPAQRRAWDLCAWAVAAAGQGAIDLPDGGAADAETFFRSAGL